MTKQKPNLLFIFTDQQRADTLEVYGNNKIHAPHLNQLAKESVVFKNAYVTQSVCTPSRATIMTGLYPHNHGCIANNSILNENIPTLAEQHRDSDYKKAYMGKWHLGNEIVPQRGFETWVSIEDEYRAFHTDSDYKDRHCSYYDFLIEHGFQPDQQSPEFSYFSRYFASRLPDPYSKPAFIAKKATQFIEENKDNPFMLYVNFFEPHSPFFSPFDSLYDPEVVGLPEGYHDKIDLHGPLKYHFNRLHADQVDGHAISGKRTEEDWKKLRAYYWGLISLVDKYVGEILKSVEANGLENDTIIVFTSDHGEMMGDFQMMTKCVQYEAAVKVPLMIKVPGIKSKVIQEPVSQIDLVPTLRELLGSKSDLKLDGKSLLGVISGEESLENNDVFIEWNGKDGESKWFQDYSDSEWKDQIDQVVGAAVRTIVTTEGWKLSLTSAGEHELYYLPNDPRETMNLYGKSEYASQEKKLVYKILEWQKRTNDQVELQLEQKISDEDTYVKIRSLR